MTETATTRLTLDELKGKKGGTRSDAPDGPDLGPEFWALAQLVKPRRKTSVHLRLDAEVLDFFKRDGEGYLMRMNAVLRAYVKAHSE